MNKLIKVLSVIYRGIIKLILYVNLDLYMVLYTKYLRKQGIVILGKPKFISNDVYFDGTDYTKISIGDNVTISREVMLLTHDYSITTALASIGEKIGRHEGELYFLKNITIGNNCFIGARVSILPGTTIGDNVIIGACSVVKGDIPSDSIIVGNPAKVIGKTNEWTKKQIEISQFLIKHK